MKMNIKRASLIVILTVVIHLIYSTITEVTIPYVMTKNEQVSIDRILVDNNNSIYRNSLTNSQLRDFYDEICSTVAEKRSVVSIPIGISESDIAVVIDYVKLDHPEYYWFDGDYVSTISNIKVSYITLTYNALVNSSENISEYIDNKVSGLINTVSSENDTDVSKIINCYTSIIKELEYNNNAKYNQSIYSAIYNRETVCFGYSKYFKACLDKLGFQNIIIIGNYRETEEGYSAHSWNAVKISDKWYYFDPTWADVEEDNIYKYFMIDIDDETFLETHEAKYLPIM